MAQVENYYKDIVQLQQRYVQKTETNKNQCRE